MRGKKAIAILRKVIRLLTKVLDHIELQNGRGRNGR